MIVVYGEGKIFLRYSDNQEHALTKSLFKIIIINKI